MDKHVATCSRFKFSEVLPAWEYPSNRENQREHRPSSNTKTGKHLGLYFFQHRSWHLGLRKTGCPNPRSGQMTVELYSKIDILPHYYTIIYHITSYNQSPVLRPHEWISGSLACLKYQSSPVPWKTRRFATRGSPRCLRAVEWRVPETWTRGGGGPNVVHGRQLDDGAWGTGS